MSPKALNRNAIGRRRLQLLVRLLRTSRGHKEPRPAHGARNSRPRGADALRISAPKRRARVPGSCQPTVCRGVFPWLNPTQRPTVAKALTLCLRSEPVLARRAVIDVPQFTSRSEAGPETINAWTVASQPNASRLSCGVESEVLNQTALGRRQLQLRVRRRRCDCD